MSNSRLTSLTEAANFLEVNVSVVNKFVSMGLVATVNDGRFEMLTPYGLRRLRRVVDLYEKSYAPDIIEAVLNH